MLPDPLIVEPKRKLKAVLKGFNGVTIQGKDGLNGRDGIDGLNGTDGRDGINGKDGLNGKDGRDGIDGLNGVDGRDGIDGKDGSLDTAEQIADKLNALEGQVDLKVLKGWKEFLSNLGEKGSATRVYGTRMLRNLVDVIGAKDATTGQVLTKQADGTFAFEDASGGSSADAFGITVDGAGSVITTGSKGTRYIESDCTITGWDIRSDISGSCVFNIKRSGVSISGTEKPTLSGASSNQDLALSTWTTSLTAGDVIEFVVDSASTLTRATVTILVTKV